MTFGTSLFMLCLSCSSIPKSIWARGPKQKGIGHRTEISSHWNWSCGLFSLFYNLSICYLCCSYSGNFCDLDQTKFEESDQTTLKKLCSYHSDGCLASVLICKYSRCKDYLLTKLFPFDYTARTWYLSINLSVQWHTLTISISSFWKQTSPQEGNLNKVYFVSSCKEDQCTHKWPILAIELLLLLSGFVSGRTCTCYDFLRILDNSRIRGSVPCNLPCWWNCNSIGSVSSKISDLPNQTVCSVEDNDE